MTVLFVLHDPPYGTERVYNGLRWAIQVARGDADVKVFLFGDAVISAMANQRVPSGYYNVEKMIRVLTRTGGVVGVCGTCLEARGVDDAMLVDGSRRTGMTELAEWTVEADKVINV